MLKGASAALKLDHRNRGARCGHKRPAGVSSGTGTYDFYIMSFGTGPGTYCEQTGRVRASRSSAGVAVHKLQLGNKVLLSSIYQVLLDNHENTL